MRSKELIPIVAGAFMLAALVPLWAPPVAGQSTPLDRTFARLSQTQKKLGPNAILSGGARNLMTLANGWGRTRATLPAAAGANIQAEARAAKPGAVSGGPDNLAFTKLAGFTQSESSAAWCGNNVVIGFNDTGSIIPSANFMLVHAATGLGYSFSTNRGESFTDAGFPTIDNSDISGFLGFDQVFTCTSANNFYFSSLFNDATKTAVTVSTSANGGKTFGVPVIASSASNVGNFFDGDWMAVDPSNPLRLFVSYTHDDTTGAVCGFDGGGHPILGTSIELVSSNDGGTTWSSPVVAAKEVCANPLSATPGAVEFSGVAVDPRGTAVYVSWEFFSVSSFPAREIDIAKASLPTPLLFGSPAKVGSVNFAGVFDNVPFGAITPMSTFFQGLQGRISDFEHPMLAIGKGSKNTGVLYVAWNDGDNAVTDILGGFDAVSIPTYHFTDILLASSIDGGNTWSAPTRVNDNVENGTPKHPFTDQFQPALATDKRGNIAVCFYDRRNDPNNFLIGRTCAVSENGGKKWENIPIAAAGATEVNQDDFALHDWRGDYDDLASDSLNLHAGFIGGYTDTSGGFQRIRKNQLRTGEGEHDE